PHGRRGRGQQRYGGRPGCPAEAFLVGEGPRRPRPPRRDRRRDLRRVQLDPDPVLPRPRDRGIRGPARERSEERRVGKEGRRRWGREGWRKKRKREGRDD